MAFPHLLRYQLNWKVVLRDRGLTWLGLTVVSSNVLIHCLSCEIIYGFTISNPCHKNQHVEIVAIMCGLTSQMPPITLQGNRNDGCLRRMRFKHIFFYLAFSRKKKIQNWFFSTFMKLFLFKFSANSNRCSLLKVALPHEFINKVKNLHVHLTI